MFKLPQRWHGPLLQQQILVTPVRLLEFIPTSTQMLPSSETLWDYSLDHTQAAETFHTRLHPSPLHAYTEILYLQSLQSYRNFHKSRSPAGLSPTPCSFVGAHKETLLATEKA